jgi:hypothetical protein
MANYSFQFWLSCFRAPAPPSTGRVKVRLVGCRREAAVESLRILDSRKAISNERVAALDFAVQIKRADAATGSRGN